MAQIIKTKNNFQRGRKFWEEHIEVWKNSSISQAEYCRQKNLKSNSFSYWNSKLYRKINSKPFIELPIKKKQNQSKEIFTCDMKLTTSYQLKLNFDISFGFLKRILGN